MGPRTKVKPMDKLALRLREDAAKIDVEISDELDDRIRASLESATQEKPARTSRRRSSISMWWASSLTGIAVALLVIVLLDRNQPEPPPAAQPMVDNDISPRPDLTFKPAVLTAPLEQELADLEADLKKAEQAVREDIGLDP